MTSYVEHLITAGINAIAHGSSVGIELPALWMQPLRCIMTLSQLEKTGESYD
jgi:hypothetical protein